MPHSGMLKSGPGLYEFLIEAELQQYYSTIKNDLKVRVFLDLRWPLTHHSKLNNSFLIGE